MSDSRRPHGLQPTRLPRPWDSPGKNTGVGCHFLLQCMKVKSESEISQSCPTLHDPMDCSLPGSSVHAIFQARVLEWVAIAFSSCLTALQICPNRGTRNLQGHSGIREALTVTWKPAAGGMVCQVPQQSLRGAGTAVSYSHLSQCPLPCCPCECPSRPPPARS